MLSNTWSFFSSLASNCSPCCWPGFYSTNPFTSVQEDKGNKVINIWESLVYVLQSRAATLYMYKPLTHGYKESIKWWAAVDLFRRFIIILVIVVLPGRTVREYLYVCVRVCVYCISTTSYVCIWMPFSSLARGDVLGCTDIQCCPLSFCASMNIVCSYIFHAHIQVLSLCSIKVRSYTSIKSLATNQSCM